jgi:hypothetical protein
MVMLCEVRVEASVFAVLHLANQTKVDQNAEAPIDSAQANLWQMNLHRIIDLFRAWVVLLPSHFFEDNPALTRKSIAFLPQPFA